MLTNDVIRFEQPGPAVMWLVNIGQKYKKGA